MLPAFVAAASVGLYSVATNVSLIVFTLANTFAALVVPAAAGDARRGSRQGDRLVLGGHGRGGRRWPWACSCSPGRCSGSCTATPSEGAATSLRLLLPGAVLFAGSSIISAGVYAAGRPFTATVPQLLGMAVTVIGLFVFLRQRRGHRGGDRVERAPTPWSSSPRSWPTARSRACGGGSSCPRRLACGRSPQGLSSAAASTGTRVVRQARRSPSAGQDHEPAGDPQDVEWVTGAGQLARRALHDGRGGHGRGLLLALLPAARCRSRRPGDRCTAAARRRRRPEAPGRASSVVVSSGVVAVSSGVVV